MAEQFDISIDRVDKLPVPLLVVGLGGTGRDAVIAIKEKFAERYNLPKTENGEDKPAPARTAYLVFDTESQQPDSLSVNEYRNISVPNLEKILKDPDNLQTQYERTWINPKMQAASHSIGAGTIRQAARVMLSRQYSLVQNALTGAFDNIISAKLGAVEKQVTQVEVVIVAGIGGGTGSGTFLDMAQIIRHVAKKCTILPINITGYIVMPDVSLDNVKAAAGMERPIKHNAYAALKELDFWMRVKEHKTPYTMRYGAAEEEITWSEPPFNYCILMSKSNVMGTPYLDGYDAVLQTIAENLLHYMAKEDAVKDLYSYKRYEDNLAAILAKKTKPVYYGYRAIGAFTKRMPKKQILYYEGKLLFKTFMPQRDERHLLVPDDTLLTDGMGEQRALSVVGEYKRLAEAFATNKAKFPSECFIKPDDRVAVGGLQGKNPAPHAVGRWQDWRDKVCAPMARKAAAAYVDEAWNRFIAMAKPVFEDPNRGPFALQKYIEDANGLLHELNKLLDEWKAVQLRLVNLSIKTKFRDCEDNWPAFNNPPLFGRANAISAYLTSLKSFYTVVSNNEFMTYHIPALEKVILRIKEYLADSLKPLCAGMELLESTFDSAEHVDSALVDDIYKLTDVQARIDDVFETVNDSNKLTVKFLGNLMDISQNHTDNKETTSSGWTFTCRRAGLDETCKAIEELLKDAYGTLNNQSLDQVMVASVGESIEDQTQWMKDLTENTINSAAPMLLQDGTYAGEDTIKYSYLSIPQDATQLLNYVSTTFNGGETRVDPKASSLTDHIYCLMAWDKLPLYRYGMMDEIHRQYYEDLDIPDYCGMHLVRTGAADADYRSDWSKLPSPNPYFLGKSAGAPAEQKEWQRVQGLAERAQKCGMMSVSEEDQACTLTVNVKYTADGKVPVAGTVLKNYLQTVRESKDESTGDALSEQAIVTKLKEYLAGFTAVTLQEAEVKPSELAALCGLSGQPVDPFDANVAADPTVLEAAKKNYKVLCHKMADVMLYRNPRLAEAMALQLDAYEEIKQVIDDYEILAVLWDRRKAYAETFSKLFIRLKDKFSIGSEGQLRYERDGERYDIINLNLLKDDLKGYADWVYLQTGAFLADAPADNPEKEDLEEMLNTELKNYKLDLDDGVLYKEDVQKLIDNANALLDDLEDEAKQMNRMVREKPALKQTFDYAIGFLKDAIECTESEIRRMTRVMNGLQQKG